MSRTFVVTKVISILSILMGMQSGLLKVLLFLMFHPCLWSSLLKETVDNKIWLYSMGNECEVWTTSNTRQKLSAATAYMKPGLLKNVGKAVEGNHKAFQNLTKKFLKWLTQSWRKEFLFYLKLDIQYKKNSVFETKLTDL